MKPQLILYSRKECCLCEDMKEVVRRVAKKVPLSLEEVDVDSFAELQEIFGAEVPVLLIDGKKAFKYRLTERELEKKLARAGKFGKTFTEMIFKR